MSTDVITAQRFLTDEAAPRYYFGSQNARAPVFPALRRVLVDAEFGVSEEDTSRLLFLIPRKATRQAHMHRLRFSLLSTAAPPEQPLRATADCPMYLLEPHFMVRPTEEREVLEGLAAILSGSLAGEVRSLIPGVPGVRTELRRKEAERLLGETSRTRGPVVLCLRREPVEYFVVRVTKKSERDSLFVYSPDSRVVRVFSIEGDEVDHVVYAPLNRVARSVRAWLEGAPAVRTLVAPEDLSIMSGLQEFAASLLDGYVDSWIALAAEPPAGRSVEAWYDISDIDAALSYSVAFDDGPEGEPVAARFSFSTRVAPDQGAVSEDYEAIESIARIRVQRKGPTAELQTEVVSPGFVLGGEVLASFVRLAQRAEDQIAGAFSESYRPFVRQGIGVVAFLAFRGKRPSGEFLVVWPGMHNGQSRDFVFTCRYTRDGLESIRAVLRLEEDARAPRLATFGGSGELESSLAKHQYEAFHNFFHAMRVWHSMVRREEER